MAVKTKPKKTTTRTPILKSAATNRMTKGAGGASKPPKTVARPSGGTKTGGGKPTGGKRGSGC